MLYIPAVEPALLISGYAVASASRPTISEIPITKHIDQASVIL